MGLGIAVPGRRSPLTSRRLSRCDKEFEHWSDTKRLDVISGEDNNAAAAVLGADPAESAMRWVYLG